MEFQKVIESRRSIRKYDAEKRVSEEQIREMIQAAIYAPSWKNSQTARYYCVLSQDMFEKVRTECLPEFNANNVEGASALIVTAVVKNRSGYESRGEPTNELGNGWGVYDLGLVMGIRDEKKLHEILSIPEEQMVVSVIGVGYGTVSPDMPKRKSVEDVAVIC